MVRQLLRTVDEKHFAEQVTGMNSAEGDGHPVEDHGARELRTSRGGPQRSAEEAAPWMLMPRRPINRRAARPS